MLIDEIIHFTLSIIAGTIVGYFANNFWAIPVALISGFFIDADHLIDYLLYSGGKFNLADFRSSQYFDDSGKVYVFAHGFEFAITLIILGVIFPHFDWIFFSLGFSNLLHLLYDTSVNGAIWPTYFIAFRIAKKFDHKKLWVRNEK